MRAVHAHEAAATLFERMGDDSRADIESQRAAAERASYVHAAAQHPEWSVDLSFGVVRGQYAGVGGKEPD